jgi:putative methionine-R-sulfoxide reductase with GAF domain
MVGFIRNCFETRGDVVMFIRNRRWLSLLFVFLLLLTGCQQIYKNYDQSIKDIEQFVEQSQWQKASHELKQMQKTYEKKYQWRDFYIAESDYTLLVEAMGGLEGAIKEKDKKEASIQITTIHSLLKQIYYQ